MAVVKLNRAIKYRAYPTEVSYRGTGRIACQNLRLCSLCVEPYAH